MLQIEFLREWRNKLGESPLWDAQIGMLYWVDTLERRICRAQPSGESYQEWVMPELVGSIALAEVGLLATLRDGFYLVDLANSTLAAIALPEKGNPLVRFNDGKADRQGRFLAGTMRIGDTNATPGILYRLEKGGRCTVLQRDIAVSNGLCFSPAGEKMYFADSLQSVVWSYDYDAITGEIGGRRLLIDTRALGSVPDGATVDAAGDLWLALFQTQQIAHFAADGTLRRLIELPVPFPSCPAFGGAGLQSLFVTTISNSGHRIRTDHPAGGRILSIEGLDTCGLPEARCEIGAMRPQPRTPLHSAHHRELA